jgi:hypothetical protein
MSTTTNRPVMCRTKTGGKMHRRLATSVRTECGARATGDIWDPRGAVCCDRCWGEGRMEVARAIVAAFSVWFARAADAAEAE